jgi:alkanesulfonate monooxygenase SsuD/methylene tetrahydromethanopterin reductase-like flavin-dependent oxidoreductase (luciferase family)
MRKAVDIAPLAGFADPAVLAEIAVAAEESGWDGFSTWDVFAINRHDRAPDPFIALAAVASATQRLRLLLSVAILGRRRPQLVAQSAGTLDQWSKGRLILGIGAGGDREDFESFGEDNHPKRRVALMDESAELIDAWLRGETVDHDGPAYVARGVAVGPTPVQRPRPPIWLGGQRPGARRRAARWDGWIPVATNGAGTDMEMTPAQLAEMVDGIQVERERLGRSAEPFDVAVFGYLRPGTERAWSAAGATWWLETFTPERGSVAETLRVIRRGPTG